MSTSAMRSSTPRKMPSEPTEEAPKTSKTGNTTIVKDGPFRKGHRSGSMQKMVLK